MNLYTFPKDSEPVILGDEFLDRQKLEWVPVPEVSIGATRDEPAPTVGAYSLLRRPVLCPDETLRDRFAMQALAGLMADPRMSVEKDGPELREAIAIGCYKMADAMLAAREAS